MAFEFLEHTGDTLIRITAASERDLFRDAATALLSVLIDTELMDQTAQTASVKESESLPLQLDAEDGQPGLTDRPLRGVAVPPGPRVTATSVAQGDARRRVWTHRRSTDRHRRNHSR